MVARDAVHLTEVVPVAQALRGLHENRAVLERELGRAPVRVHGDPELDLRLALLPYRWLQLGLAGEGARPGTPTSGSSASRA